jgi:hypothetical protein
MSTLAVDDDHAAWLRGFAAAIGAVQRQHDRPTIVRDVLTGNGVTLDDLRSAEVEEFDLDPIQKALGSAR